MLHSTLKRGSKYYSNPGNPEGRKCKQRRSMQRPISVRHARGSSFCLSHTDCV